MEGDRKVYYFSAEFLIGKLMSNNLINLGIRKEVKELFKENGKSLEEIEEIEAEPSLGNGGLGRLAACFLDSIATLDLPGDGVGLNYHLGLFKQVFEYNKQCETPNPWINDYSWLIPTNKHYTVEFKDFSLKSQLYDLDVLGYKGNKNKLHLFDIASVDESMVHDGISFDKSNIVRNLTLFLYPDDSDEAGCKLRIYQQYFMVSNGAQMILEDIKSKGISLTDLDKHVCIQINDTHPSMVIPELIRLLMKEGLTMKQAIDIASKTCAYTNHTILAEALEKWPLSYLEEIVPQLVPIIEALDAVAKERSTNEKVAIIDNNKIVHKAHMDIHFGFSINGVASIHTDILKNTELHDFYELYPTHFNNKTNGITFRRWLLSCNEELTDLIDSLIGEGYKQDASELEKLQEYLDDEAVLNKLLTIKQEKKTQLANVIKEKEGIELDPSSIFDVQVKRLHEYKRQQMNVLYIIYQYLQIKAGHKPAHTITCIFGAKAAPAYILAKDIVHTLLCLQQLIDNDPEVSPYLKVVMVENYNVTYAESIIPAADFSEQISLASKEASGTSNMKFMLNGAVTLGTDDGANVEIHEFVGDDNIYIFGAKADTVIDHYAKGDYYPQDILNNDPELRTLVDFIVSDEMKSVGDVESLERLHNDMSYKDWFMALLDARDYIETKVRAINDYKDRKAWAKKMLVNISKAGFFSSDRTIAQYNEDIWKLK
ncbi:glycogen/starch/alpha-glucan phosphorylase [Catenibacterium mitsuokai]|uniref:glycogen/starch/alpha-glucan phosphorylase n=1 Tax=Catenibacterium mitsuokai TaxID=100886 RepID=UPI003F92CD53